MQNHIQRSKIQKSAAKKLLSKPKGRLEPVDIIKSGAPGWMTRVYTNNRYVVMIQDEVTMSDGSVACRAMIQRHDAKPIPNHWREVQSVKNEIFGDEAMGIEYYPAESELINDANVYWLWIFPEGVIPRQVDVTSKNAGSVRR